MSTKCQKFSTLRFCAKSSIILATLALSTVTNFEIYPRGVWSEHIDRTDILIFRKRNVRIVQLEGVLAGHVLDTDRKSVV